MTASPDSLTSSQVNENYLYLYCFAFLVTFANLKLRRNLNRIKLVDQNATADMILLHYQEKEEKVQVDMSANPDPSSNTLQVRFEMSNVVIYRVFF